MIKFSNKFSNKFIIFHLDFENWSVKVHDYFEGDLSSDDVLVKAVQELAEQKPLADASTGRFRYPDASQLHSFTASQSEDDIVDLTIEPATSAKTDEQDQYALKADAETAGGANLPILTPTGEYFYFN